MFTIWPAYSTFQATSRGSIEVGKRADLSVFNTDFMTADPAEILEADTVMTMVDGRITYAQSSVPK